MCATQIHTSCDKEPFCQLKATKSYEDVLTTCPFYKTSLLPGVLVVTC